jgi:hypothetical protein
MSNNYKVTIGNKTFNAIKHINSEMFTINEHVYSAVELKALGATFEKCQPYMFETKVTWIMNENCEVVPKGIANEGWSKLVGKKGRLVFTESEE